jgi:hypothetical protein
MDAKYHFVHQEDDRGAITVVKFSTGKQAADGLTTSLNRVKHEQFKQLFGTADCSRVIAGGMDKGQYHYSSDKGVCCEYALAVCCSLWLPGRNVSAYTRTLWSKRHNHTIEFHYHRLVS